MESDKKTKLDVVSGFLGAGKTTFIQKLICDIYGEENVVVLENEFGKISLDGETLSRHGIKVESICAGCICCTSAGELSRNIVSIIDRYHPDRIVVEPTGLAKLSDIRILLAEPFVSDVCVVDHVVTIVDAKNYDKRMMISKEFFEDQIRNSEVIFLSKTGDLDASRSNEIAHLIEKLHPGCTVISQPFEQITINELKNSISHKTEIVHDHCEDHHHHCEDHSHHDIFESFSYESDDLVEQDSIRNFLSDISAGIYGEIHRGKGVFRDKGSRWFSFEYVPGETRIIQNEQGTAHIGKIFQMCIIGTELKKDLLQNKAPLIFNNANHIY